MNILITHMIPSVNAGAINTPCIPSPFIFGIIIASGIKNAILSLTTYNLNNTIYLRSDFMIKPILLLGNQELYEKSIKISNSELEDIKLVVNDLHDTLMDFRKTYNAGRAIAAPQIGIKKRLLYMHIDKPVVFINPIIKFVDDELMDVLDDCMSFPNLLVKVKRHKRCIIEYKDINWNNCSMNLEDDLSELLQHEYDHLDGILATMRAIDNKSFYMKKS